ncbi:MAG: OmpH family outer membrane protein [Chitinophagaceae bacterium]|jgi:outer membrane protein
MNQKNINIVLFVLLGVMAIALFLNVNKTPAANTSVATDSKLKIAYVDLDSIQANYLYYKEKMSEFDKKKEDADRQLNTAFQRIEEERIAFAKKGQAITQAEYENFQRSYQTKMQNLEEQKRNMENAISMDGVKTLEELKGKIDAFLVEYNKDNKYSYIFSTSNSMNVLFYKDSTNNITSEVVAGLNKAYNKTNPKK